MLKGPSQLCIIPLRVVTTYNSVTAVALAQTITFTNATVFTAYSNFAAQITNIWNEYRVESIQLKITPIPGISAAGLYPTGLHVVTMQTQVPPAPTIATLSKLPGYRILPLFDKTYTVTWHRTNDPEDKTFYDTAGAPSIIGCVLCYIGASAPTLGTPYMVIQSTYMVCVRGRKV